MCTRGAIRGQRTKKHPRGISILEIDRSPGCCCWMCFFFLFGQGKRESLRGFVVVCSGMRDLLFGGLRLCSEGIGVLSSQGKVPERNGNAGRTGEKKF